MSTYTQICYHIVFSTKDRFTHSRSQIDGLIEYIKGQEEHHHRFSFAEELRKLLEEAGIEYDERYLL